MDWVEALPVCADDMADWTASDPVLQQALRKVQQGVTIVLIQACSLST